MSEPMAIQWLVEAVKYKNREVAHYKRWCYIFCVTQLFTVAYFVFFGGCQ